jgi:tetratricopeptide (TPR) repeat protein
MELQLADLASGVLEDKASIEAALGSHALGIGDTVSASEHYREAGRILKAESTAQQKSEKKARLRFLAASQFFHGGDYKQARKLARRTDEGLLPAEVRHLLKPFVRDVESRAAPDYVKTMRVKLVSLGVHGQVAEAIGLLKSHPYVLDRTELSYARAYLCEEMQRYVAAAVFYGRAIKFDPEKAYLPYVSVAYPLWLPSVGKLDEAWNYIQIQLKEIAHPITVIAASILRFRMASVSHGDEQRVLLKDQLEYFEKGWAAYQKMGPALRDNPDLRSLMRVCFEFAAFALWKLDLDKDAIKVATEGIRFNPKYAGLYNARGMIQSRTPEGRADFEQAIRLGEKSYSPHYYLAKRALEEEEFAKAQRHIEKALSSGPGPQIRGQLIGWTAICVARTGEASVEDVKALFKEAIAIAPDVPEIKDNYEAFLRYVGTTTFEGLPKDIPWNLANPPEVKDISSFDRAFDNMKSRKPLRFPESHHLLSS